MKKGFLTAVCFSLIFASAGALAEDGQDLLSLGAGVWDIGEDQEAGDFRLEYRPNTGWAYNIRPWAGAEATSEGSLWGGGGFLIDWRLSDNIYVNPSVGVGLYTDGGSDLDLGYPIEFRSQLEAGYAFESGRRLGVAFGHLSNASLDDNNPGTEVLNLYYHVPVDGLF